MRYLYLCKPIAINAVFLLILSIISLGCNSTFSYMKTTQGMANTWEAGDVEGTLLESEKLLDKQREKWRNNIIFFLEHAAVLRAAGRFEDSNWHFQTALDLMDERKGDLSGQSQGREKTAKAASEMVAVLSNLNVLPYTGYGYDRIMAHTYITLNYLALGNRELAQVELNRLYATQQYLVSEEYEKQINKDEAKIQRQQRTNEAKLVNAGAKMSVIHSRLSGVRQSFTAAAAYAPYVNPFATYLKALFDGTNGSKENARVMMSKVSEFSENSFVKSDLELLSAGKEIESVTYVIFESNMAPFRSEKLINLVIPIPVEVDVLDVNGYRTGRTRTEIVPFNFSFSWPKLNDKGQPNVSQSVISNGREITTELIADVEAIVAKEFNNLWPGMRNRIVLSVVAKAAASVVTTVAVKKATGSGLLGTLLAAGAGTAVTHFTKGTDSRTWRTLPSNFQVCRIPTPSDRKIKLKGPSGNEGNLQEISLVDGNVNVVYIKQTSPEARMLVHQFKLN